MTIDLRLRGFLLVYLFIFFVFLFAPLVLMTVTAFNPSSFPRVWPLECVTLDWFAKALQDQRLRSGLGASAIVAFGAVLLSVPLGLAGALSLMQVWPRLRGPLYMVMVAPILIPGVVLGVATFIFWRRMELLLGLGPGYLSNNGIALTVLGQSCYIAAYCMLVFLARLERFDRLQFDAARDLGATYAQAFRRILLPFLRPAIGAAVVLAAISSFENYSITIFTIGQNYTFTTEIAQRARIGTDPSLSAIAVILIIFSFILYVSYEFARQRTVSGQDGTRFAKGLLYFVIVASLLSLVISVGLSWFESNYACPVSAPMGGAPETDELLEPFDEFFPEVIQ
jgi:spermidine/putrescine transport system permease protein